MTITLFEDRPHALIGVKLAALSLARHSPGVQQIAWVPDAPNSFVDWAMRRAPSLEVRTHREGIVGQGFNVKPSVLLRTLAEGHEQAVWFDTDMVATGDVAGRLAKIPVNTIVGTEEYYWGHHQGGTRRTEGLGLSVARTFEATINTCLLRVAQRHVDFVQTWFDVLAGPDYAAARTKSARERPLQLWSDLDVLTGLLGAKEWADIPVVQLKRGRDIAQCFGPSGFTTRERLACGRQLPLIIHAMGRKPWASSAPASGNLIQRMHAALDVVHRDLTPYVDAAREYRDELDEPVEWLDPGTAVGAFMTRMLPGRPLLREVPLTLVDSIQRAIRRRLSVGRIGADSK